MIERVAALMRVGSISSSSSSSSSPTSAFTKTPGSSTRSSSNSVFNNNNNIVPFPFTPAAAGIGVVVTLSSSFSKNNTTPVLLACSSSSVVVRQEHREILGMRTLCEDRRGVWDHLSLRKLSLAALRVTITQATQLYSSYMSDQLQADIKRDDLVRQGKLSPDNAVEQEEEWIETEWNHRIQHFPQKLCTAYMKYHAITLVMRLYEEIASRFVSTVMLDKLTLDTFASAKRRQQRESTSNNGTSVSSRIMEMTREGWYANLIAFMADYSVHQIILAYGYYSYIHRHRLEKRQERHAAAAAANQATDSGDDENDNDPLHPGSLVLSFTKKSTLLALSRIIALAMASVGAALGTMVVPGWGTLAGTNFGDGIAASLTDDFVTDL